MNESEFTRARPIIDLVQREYETTIAQTYRNYEHNLDYVQKVVVLTAGVIAFVPGLLTRGTPLDSVLLHRALGWLFSAFALGIVGLLVSRIYLMPILGIVAGAREAFFTRLGSDLSDDVFDRVVAADAARSEFLKAHRGILYAVLWGTFVLEFVFYSVFLRGVFLLYRAYLT
jgi:hypothetical protein